MSISELGGKYWIHLAADPKPAVGVYGGHVNEKPVITGGINNVWNVEKLDDGYYNLTLEDGADHLLFLRDVNRQVIGTIKPLPPLPWSIRQHPKSGGSYTIEVTGDIIPTGWTVDDPERESPVYIKHINSETPQPNQLWNFVRWPGPE